MNSGERRKPPSGVASVHRLHAALAGDSCAWGDIVSEYINLLWWIARSHRLDDATAADVVQTVWLKLLKRGNDIRDPNCLGAWLATTCRREATARHSRPTLPLDDLTESADPLAPQVDEGLMHQELMGMVLAAFKKLTPEEQRLLQLSCDVPTRSYDEIAAILGRTHGYVGPTRQRALKKLRGHLRGMGWS